MASSNVAWQMLSLLAVVLVLCVQRKVVTAIVHEFNMAAAHLHRRKCQRFGSIAWHLDLSSFLPNW